MFTALPVYPWEIPMASDLLLCGALASGRSIALEAGPRLGGLPDSEVSVRYTKLRDALRERASVAPEAAHRLDELETAAAEMSLTRWQTAIWAMRADDEVDLVELAREVWVALGANEYALRLRERPRSSRGFVEGRMWGLATTIPPVLLGISAVALVTSGNEWGWVVTCVAVTWPVVVLSLLRSTYRKRLRIGGRELPHL
jgi:hypothetical protein